MENRIGAGMSGVLRSTLRLIAGRRGRALRRSLAVALLFVLAGDRGMAKKINGIDIGIDPFQLMDVQVKPNILFMLDASRLMRDVPFVGGFTVGGDDIQSRFYLAKRAIRKAITDNKALMNVGLAYFGPTTVDPATGTPNKRLSGLGDPGGPLVYVSNPSESGAKASTWAGFFNTASCTGSPTCTPLPFANYDGLQGGVLGATSNCPTSSAVTDTNCSKEVFNSFNTSENGFTSSTRSRFYVKSRLFRNGVKYQWKSTSGSSGLTGIVSITCPVPPKGLLADDTADTNDGVQSRPCFQLEDTAGSGSLTTYYLSSGVFDTTSTACSGALAKAVAFCTDDASSKALDSLKLEMPLASSGTSSGTPSGLPSPAPPGAPALLIGTQPNTNGDPAVGIQAGGPNALTDSLQFALDKYIDQTVFPPKPKDARGFQKNFVLLVTASDSSIDPKTGKPFVPPLDGCSKDPAATAQTLYDNQLPTLEGAEVNRIRTLVVAVTIDPAKVKMANNIARAGSGGKIVTDTGDADYNLFTCDTTKAVGVASECRDAFIARTSDALDGAIRAALDQALFVGEFSDQQSITESIFEFASNSSSGVDKPSDPKTRYNFTTPLLLQSTYNVPGFKGHLKAFKAGATGEPVEIFTEAGQNLKNKLDEGICGTVRPCTTEFTFDQLINGATLATAANSKIRRRILTTTRNGVFATDQSDPVQDLVDRATQAALVPLWPPTRTSSGVAPSGNTNPAGVLDGPLGLSTWSGGTGLTFTQLQDQFGACLGSFLPSACTSTTASTQLAQAVREAREMILAFNAGAQVVRDPTTGNLPVRDATSRALLYTARSWILSESSLSAPAVMTPPPASTPGIFPDEWRLYRDAILSTGTTPTAQNGIRAGFGLRNADDDNTATAATETSLEAQMSVIFHGANDMLHAFRAGPNCDDKKLNCTETGGEELWGFVPFDLLGKLKDRMVTQERDPHVYMIAAPIRIADIFVPGSFKKTVGSVTVSSSNGAWRTVILFGRGIGGKSLTALDVTGLGAYTDTALGTAVPIVLWSRGNLDTQDGTTGVTKNHDTTDYNAYLKMGQTWSVPAIAFVDKSSFKTGRKGSNGLDFVAYLGSGYGSTSTEGQTFYTLDPLTGDVVTGGAQDITDTGAATGYDNALVASPAAFNPDVLQPGSTANSAQSFVTRVYIGDIKGRVWKFGATSGPTGPFKFADLGAGQPIATAAALLNYNGDGSGQKPHVYVETGYDNRVPPPSLPAGFLLLGFRDDGSADQDLLGTELFRKVFGQGFRGTVQPATAFKAEHPGVTPTLGRVFFAGNRFNGVDSVTPATCFPTFDSILFALGAATGGAAYDFGAGVQESYTMAKVRIQAIRTAGGQLVIDKSLSAEDAPPPPTPPADTTGGSKKNQVFVTKVRGASEVCQ